MPNPIICVDFDGVIHSYASGWKGADVIPDPPVDGAIEWLIAHLPVPDALGMAPEYAGPIPVIYSARSAQRGGIAAMKQWLIKWGVDEWYFRDDILKFPKEKPAAFLTIDDRCICFDGRFPTSEEMMGFLSWQKKDVDGKPVAQNSQEPSSTAEERQRRIYYQGIVYEICNIIDHANRKKPGSGIVCGTKDSPTRELQEAVAKIIGEYEILPNGIARVGGMLTDATI